ncbi:MAG: IS630 transposase-related protein [Betaproteobacteria bacterium]|nr:IS630 transposase-related protein [Betaproteobacteria bacterium]
MAYSKDFRCLVLDFVANGGSKAEAARRFGISRQSVFDWLKHPPDHKPGTWPEREPEVRSGRVAS